MAGSEKGVASRILRIHRLAVYIHCFAHRLNLSIMKVSNITLVRDVFDHTRVIADFFTNSPKRAEFLEHIFSELDGIVRKLINICRTRYIQSILIFNDTISFLFQNLILFTLKEILSKVNHYVLGTAHFPFFHILFKPVILYSFFFFQDG